MSSRYWDSGTTSGTWSTNDSSWSNASNTSSNYCYYRTAIRRFLVASPEHWTDDDALAFVELINEKTNTGFKVTMLIKGDVLITDPWIEKRTMEEFLPLLRSSAVTRNDRTLIDEFFKLHPLKVENDVLDV